MKNIMAYLAFNGNCREAMNFYKDCLGGELELMTFEGSPMAAEMPAAAQQGIMHSCLKTDNGIALMASDGMPNDTITVGNAVTLYLACDSLEEQEKHYKALSEGGAITMPLADTFWGSRFGLITDKFGIHWMFDHTLPKE